MLITLLLITKSKESTNFLYKRIYIFFTGFLVIVFSETTLRMIEDQINQKYKNNYNTLYFNTHIVSDIL